MVFALFRKLLLLLQKFSFFLCDRVCSRSFAFLLLLSFVYVVDVFLLFSLADFVIAIVIVAVYFLLFTCPKEN